MTIEHRGWADDPLPANGRDTLGRRRYAARAAELIARTHSFDSSVVFGLSGDWGSGKTTLIGMIVDELTTKLPQWRVATFTPWATADTAGLLEDFYAALAQTLPASGAKKVRRALGTLAHLSAPAATLLPVGAVLAERALKAAGDQLAKRGSWRSAFDEASSLLTELGQPILVVVDDIDRLHADELTVLLKVVRLLGRLPGVQYLLAYDDETLYGNLAVSGVVGGSGSAERFMEKIVQYPLFVPPLLPTQQLDRLNEGLLLVRADAAKDESLDVRLSALLETFTGLLRTPRAIDRYAAQLRHHVPMIDPGEIDDGDVYLLTLLRVTCPAMYNALPYFRDQLISGHANQIPRPGRRGVEYDPFDVGALLALAPERHRAHARTVLSSLFPKLENERRGSVHPSRSGVGVSVANYFDRYFAMDIPAHDVRDAGVHAAATAAHQGDARPLVGLLSSDQNRRTLVISKLAGDANQPSDDAGRLAFGRVLAGLVDGVEAGRGLFSLRSRVVALLGSQLAGLGDGAEPSDVLETLAPLGTNAGRLEVFDSARGQAERGGRLTLPWADSVMARLGADAVDTVLANLAAGDTAPNETGIGYNIVFAVENGFRVPLRDGIARMLDEGTADLATVASRLVSVRSFVGSDVWELSPDINQGLFDKVVSDADDPWYAEPVQAVDMHDYSWSNRRRYATGRFRRPEAHDASTGEESAQG